MALSLAPQSHTAADSLATLRTLLEQSCEELADAYAASSRVVDRRVRVSSARRSRLDFSDAALSGALWLNMSAGFLDTTVRSVLRKGHEPTDDALDDWACELANQLLGRLKNKLRAFDVGFSLSLPRLLSAEEHLPAAPELVVMLDGASGPFAALLSVRLQPGLHLREVPDPPSLNEGEFIVF
ncbi:MAG: chemotaxis protein CheX [Myxococcota bacterium]